jgi:hypothetical protein
VSEEVPSQAAEAPARRARSERLLNGMQTLAILVGLVYGGIQLAQIRAEQRRQANIELARSFLTPEFVEGMEVILSMPAGATLESTMADAPRILQVLNTFAVIGVLVHRGDLDLAVANEFLGEATISAWLALRPIIEEGRARSSNRHAQEWFQWLAERLLELRERAARPPAYETYRDWQPD